jgi:hypothetical protein
MAVTGGATVVAVGRIVADGAAVPGTCGDAGVAVEPQPAARTARASQPAYRRVHVVADICRY